MSVLRTLCRLQLSFFSLQSPLFFLLLPSLEHFHRKACDILKASDPAFNSTQIRQAKKRHPLFCASSYLQQFTRHKLHRELQEPRRYDDVHMRSIHRAQKFEVKMDSQHGLLRHANVCADIYEEHQGARRWHSFLEFQEEQVYKPSSCRSRFDVSLDASDASSCTILSVLCFFSGGCSFVWVRDMVLLRSRVCRFPRAVVVRQD